MLSFPRSMVWVLALFASTATASADEPAAKPATNTPTIEYVVRFLHLESPNPIEPSVANASPEEIAAALDKWRKDRVIQRITTLRLSCLDGGEALAENSDERQIVAGQDKFAGRLPDPKGTIPAAEQRTVVLKLRARIANGSIVTEYQFDETTSWEPLVDVPLDDSKNPMFGKLPKKTNFTTTLRLVDGVPTITGRITARNTAGHEARFGTITARIAPAKK